MLLFKFPELKDAKQASTVNKNDLALDHHQHNGNIKSTLSLYSDKNEKNSEIDTTHTVKLPVAVGEKVHNICIDVEPKPNDVEVATPDEQNVQPTNPDENTKAVDEYEHSLWQWPSGRSCFTKVI